MTVTIDFFQIDQTNSIGLIEVFENIKNTSLIQRTRPTGKEYATITDLEERNGLWYGTIVKIRMNNIPKKANLHGHIEDFDLAEDEGVGEETSFLYDPHPQVRSLVMQYNHYGVKTSGFREYISKFLANAEFELSPILTTDALQRMARQSIIRRLEMRFAAPTNPNVFADSDTSTSALLDIMNAFDGGQISFEIQADRARDSSLSFRPVRRLIETMLGNREIVSTLKLYGKETDIDAVKPIDLLHDRMVEINPFSANRQNRLFPVRVYTFLEEAYDKRRGEIYSQFILNGD